MQSCLYRMKHYLNGKSYVNVNMITSIDEPDDRNLFIAIGEHRVRSFIHDSGKAAMNTFQDIKKIMGEVHPE